MPYPERTYGRGESTEFVSGPPKVIEVSGDEFPRR